MAHAVCDTADMFKAPLLGMVGTLHETIYEKRGHVFLSEYYTDLDYGDDGQLAITREHEEVNSSGGGGTQPEGHPREPDPLARRQGRESARRHHLRPFRYSNAVAIATAVREAAAPYLWALLHGYRRGGVG
jgi:UPF0271 protein